jgi:uncharacterized protein DUF5329
MKRARAFLAVLFLLVGICPAARAAKRPEAEQKKIDWLIERVGQSNAVFYRNGTAYDAAKAASHLKFKLFMAGARVQTVKDFVEGVASSSSETGQPYLIRPHGAAAPIPMHDWLTARLAEYDRAQGKPIPTQTPAPKSP